MVVNNGDSQENQAISQEVVGQGENDRQSMLLKLAERTVIQAEAMAQEIKDRAREESESEGARILARYHKQAESEAQQIVESAQLRGENLINEATVNAQQGSEDILSKAGSEARDILKHAQAEAEEVLRRTQMEALGIISTAQARAEGTESKARLKAEFIIRETTQSVSDGIRSAIHEVCNQLLPSLNDLHVEGALERVENYTLDQSSSASAESSEHEVSDTDSQPSNKSPVRRSKSATPQETP